MGTGAGDIERNRVGCGRMIGEFQCPSQRAGPRVSRGGDLEGRQRAAGQVSGAIKLHRERILPTGSRNCRHINAGVQVGRIRLKNPYDRHVP